MQAMRSLLLENQDKLSVNPLMNAVSSSYAKLAIVSIPFPFGLTEN